VGCIVKKSDNSGIFLSTTAEIHGVARTSITMPSGQVVVDYFNDGTDDLTLGSNIFIGGIRWTSGTIPMSDQAVKQDIPYLLSQGVRVEYSPRNEQERMRMIAPPPRFRARPAPPR
jgi:hypothetical protein